MERINSSENELLGQVQPQDATQQHICSISKMLQALGFEEPEPENADLQELEAENAWLKAVEVENTQLKAEKACMEELGPENPLLKILEAKHAATMKNIPWGEKRKTVVEQMEYSASLLKSKDNPTSLVQLVRSAKARVKELENELRNCSFKVQEEEIIFLNVNLELEQAKNKKIQHEWKTKCEALQANLEDCILENEARSRKIEELQKQLRDADERWSIKHEEMLQKEIKLKDMIKLMIQQSIEWEILKTDSFKERAKKEKKEREKREESKETTSRWFHNFVSKYFNLLSPLPFFLYL
ncbi:uncharacterized protein [Paralichthys olivaceus]|uniref:uncharacterized protein isoform X2 n=1 Tax=Paralichthys olivaceus TaxID=8255 RepID=UPI00375318BB